MIYHSFPLDLKSALYFQLRRNSIPTITRGPAIKKYTLKSNLPQPQIIYNSPSKIKRIPPIHSRRQVITSTTIRINVGIRCIKRAKIVSQIPLDSPNTSRAKKLINTVNTIQSVLGAKYNNFLEVLRFRVPSKR